MSSAGCLRLRLQARGNAALRSMPASLLCALTLGLTLALTLAPPAAAQGLYRIVGPDGRITYSDRPPPDAASRVTPMSAAGVRASTDGNAPWPEELKQAAARFPVTLYTTPQCEPCATGRTLLTRRGVPFSEKTVSTAADVQALQRLAGTQSLPVLTIGGQQLRGFSEADWTQYLNLAGYPKTSMLPASYRAAEPTPLTTAAAPVVAPTAATSAAAGAATDASGLPPPLPAPALPGPTADNPTGIRF